MAKYTRSGDQVTETHCRAFGGGLRRYHLLVIVFPALLLISGCSTNSECPACPDLPPVIELYSGTISGGNLGECPSDVDALTYVTSVCNAGPPEAALIWKGHQSDRCLCGNVDQEVGSPNSEPVSAACIEAIEATFTRTFIMPDNFKWAHLKLAIAADDWADVYLNDHSIGLIRLPESSNYPASGAIFVFDSSLFNDGQNTLRFEVGNGTYPNPSSRVTVSDCFWLEYSGTVEYGF